MSEHTKSEIEQMIEECSARLREHCDSVRIFVTFPANDGEGNTGFMTVGAGNIYAQEQQVRIWMKLQRMCNKAFIRKEAKSRTGEES